MARVEIIFYFDVLSSWSYIGDRALERIEEKYRDGVRVDRRIAQLFDYGALPYSQEDLRWYYARTEKMTGVRLNPAWHDSPETTTVYANQAAEAVRFLGIGDSHVRRSLTRAALVDGKPLAGREAAAAYAAAASGLSQTEIEKAMDSAEVKGRIAQTTQEFKDLALPQLPSFLLRNDTGDLAAFSGLYTFESLDGAIAEMLHASRVTEEFGPKP